MNKGILEKGELIKFVGTSIEINLFSLWFYNAKHFLVLTLMSIIDQLQWLGKKLCDCVRLMKLQHPYQHINGANTNAFPDLVCFQPTGETP